MIIEFSSHNAYVAAVDFLNGRIDQFDVFPNDTVVIVHSDDGVTADDLRFLRRNIDPKLFVQFPGKNICLRETKNGKKVFGPVGLEASDDADVLTLAGYVYILNKPVRRYLHKPLNRAKIVQNSSGRYAVWATAVDEAQITILGDSGSFEDAVLWLEEKYGIAAVTALIDRKDERDYIIAYEAGVTP